MSSLSLRINCTEEGREWRGIRTTESGLRCHDLYYIVPVAVTKRLKFRGYWECEQ